jgi:hypothetical protein
MPLTDAVIRATKHELRAQGIGKLKIARLVGLGSGTVQRIVGPGSIAA